MRLNKYLKQNGTVGVFLAASLLMLTSCGSYDYATQEDGIYGERRNQRNYNSQPAPNSNTQNPNYYSSFFSQKSAEIDNAIADDVIFTDVDSYSSENYDPNNTTGANQNYEDGQPSWGSDSEEVTVNIINTGGFYNRGGFYNGFYGSGFGFGFGNPFFGFNNGFYGSGFGFGFGGGFYGYGGGFPFGFGYGYPYYSFRRGFYGRSLAFGNFRNFGRNSIVYNRGFRNTIASTRGRSSFNNRSRSAVNNRRRISGANSRTRSSSINNRTRSSNNGNFSRSRSGVSNRSGSRTSRSNSSSRSRSFSGSSRSSSRSSGSFSRSSGSRSSGSRSSRSSSRSRGRR